MIQDLTLSYSDGRPDVIGIDAVNDVLRTVGVRVSQAPRSTLTGTRC
ncbi:hypothetical protein LWC34_05865 [Kibdelosporangium philippinense]|uniref:Uncharacterized protein n=1 Tax=Kibdelosporangium philippinense TaxID=211113 RepID=A0ABS8Z337_9PSEU|nr:hypothetical protein [Kibdelosporangium philippinense]MCE7002359.1 hypothetical protein [Kibdelosporangium philippinense]